MRALVEITNSLSASTALGARLFLGLLLAHSLFAQNAAPPAPAPAAAPVAKPAPAPPAPTAAPAPPAAPPPAPAPAAGPTLKPVAAPAAAGQPASGPQTGPMDFPLPGEGAAIGKMPKGDGALAEMRKKYFYLGELTWRGGMVLGSESSDWAGSRKTSIEQDIFRQASSSNSSTNVPVPLAQNGAMNYMVGIEGLLGLNIDRLPGFRTAKWAKDKKFLRIGFHAYMAPFYKNTTQTVAGPFDYVDPGTVCANCAATRTYAGTVQVDESLLSVAPGLSFFYWYERGFFDHKLMPYGGFEVGLSIVYGKRKYMLNSQPYTTTIGADTVTYTLEANLQESIINDFGFRFMPALGFQYHVKSGHYLDLRIGYQIQEYTVTLNRRGSLTETKNTNGSFAVTYSEDFVNKSRTAKLSQSGFVILLGYTAGLF